MGHSINVKVKCLAAAIENKATAPATTTTAEELDALPMPGFKIRTHARSRSSALGSSLDRAQRVSPVGRCAAAQPHFTPLDSCAKWICGLKILPRDFEEAPDVLEHVCTISALPAD